MESSKRIVTGLWDCEYCGRKRISSTQKTCPGCGRHVGDHVKYYLGDRSEQQVITRPTTDDRLPEWKCDYCGAYNRYTAAVCTQCGASRDKGEDYFQATGADRSWHKVTDSGGMSPERAPDHTPPSDFSGQSLKWRCEHCGAHNDASAETCARCGAEKPGLRESETPIEKSWEPSAFSATDWEETRAHAIESSEYEESFPVEIGQRRPERAAQKRWKPSAFSFKAAVITFLVLVATAITLWAFIPHETSVEILEKNWEREIEIEHYITVRESDWSVPSGGRIQSTSNRIHHYDHVVDHYETVEHQRSRQVQDGYRTEERVRDLGNGNFEIETYQVPEYRTEYYTETTQEPVYIDVPVYRTWYEYDIERWKPARTIPTSGVNDEPYWGTFTLADNERERTRNEAYYIRYAWKDSNKVFGVSEEQYHRYEPGQTLVVKANRLGVVSIIE